MADLGQLTTDFFSVYRIDMPFYRAVGNTEFDNVDKTGSITGTVTAVGVVQAYKKVHLYWRDNGKHIATTLTDANGDYSFTGLDVNTNKYYVVCTSDHANGFNAQVFDKITPV